MAQTLQLGRLGIEIDIDDPKLFSWTTDGQSRFLNIQGDFHGSTLAETTWFRDQIADYGSMNNPVIPITWTGSDAINGYYKVTNTMVNLMSQADGGVVEWSGVFEYLGSVNDLDFESKLIVALRTNGWTITTGTYNPTWQPPALADLPDDGIGEMTILRSRSGTEDGFTDTIIGFDMRTSEEVDPIWTCDPADFLKASVKIYSGGRIIVGTHAPPDMVDDWEMSNGVLRVSFDPTRWLRIEPWDNSSNTYVETYAWDFRHEDGIGGWEDFDDPEYVSIIRNDPEVCTIRFSGPGQWTQSSRFTVDMTLRRGSMHVEFWVKGLPTSEGNGFRISPRPNVAATTTPGGMYKTTNTAAGNRWVYGFADGAWVRNTTNGYSDYGISSGIPDDGLSFFIGVNLGGSTPLDGFTPWDIVQDYMGLVYERVQPILR